MQTVSIDRDFKRPIPRLYPGTYALLDGYVSRYDRRDPLVHWRGVLIDSYGKRPISTEFYYPFYTERMEFPTYEGSDRFMYC